MVGRSSFVIAPSVILSGLATTHAAFDKPIPPGASEVALRSLDVITLGQLVAFGATWWLAIAHRRDPAMHVSLIVSTLFASAMRSSPARSTSGYPGSTLPPLGGHGVKRGRN